MASRRILFVMCLMLCCCCKAQRLLLTQTGMACSEEQTKPYVEYAYRDCNREQMMAYLDQKFKSTTFFNYSIKKVGDNTITIKGYMENASFLMLGSKEISFTLQLEMEEKSVKIDVKLAKGGSGKPLNYGIMFSKKGKVRFVPAKNKIEDEINGLIEQIFDTKVIIN